MARSIPAPAARWFNAGLLALLTGTGLYLCTFGLVSPTLETLPAWGFEAAYAVCAGVLHFLLWPLWHRPPRRPDTAFASHAHRIATLDE